MANGRFVVSEVPPSAATLEAEARAAMGSGEFLMLLLDDVPGHSIKLDVLIAAWAHLNNLQRAVLVWTLGLNGSSRASNELIGAHIHRLPSQVNAVREEGLGKLRDIMWHAPQA